MGIRKPYLNPILAAITRREFLRTGGIVLPSAMMLPSIFTGVARAATTFDYYISPSGSDSNPGTQSQPWAITALNTKRSVYSPTGLAGKSIGLLDGTYNVAAILNSVTQDGYVPAFDINGGISGGAVVIAAVNPQKAIITAKNGSTYGCSGGNPIFGHTDAVPKRGYVTIDGIVFTGASGKCADWGSYGSSSTGVRYPGWILRNCEFTDCNAVRHGLGGNYSLAQMYGGSDCLIQNNYFHDNVGWQSGSPDHHSAIIMWYTDNPIVEYNTIVNSSNIYGKENGNQGAVIRYNYVDTSMYTSGGVGIQDMVGTPTTGLTSGLKIYNNVIIAMQGIDLCATLSNGVAGVPSADVYNNTIVMTAGAAIMGFRAWAKTRSISFYNNLITGVIGTDPGTISSNVSALSLSDYNFLPSAAKGMKWSTFSDAGPPGTRTGSSSLTAWRTSIGLSVADQNSLFFDSPNFVSTGTNADRYRLQNASLCKNAGRVGGVSSGAVTDIGAWGNGVVRIGCILNVTKPASPSVA